MSITMNKQFEHKGHNFNIKVELNTKVEKRLDGDRWHTVTINCMDYSNYYVKLGAVADAVLEATIINLENDAKEYIDNKFSDAPSADERLTKLGFK